MKSYSFSSRSIVILLLVLLVPAQGGRMRRPRIPEESSFFESKQFQRWSWAYRRRAASDDSLETKILQQAVERLRELTESTARTSGKVGGTGLVESEETWISIGPTPIEVGTDDVFAGRVAAVSVDPGDPDHWLAGAAQGGLWESPDAGRSWRNRTGEAETLASGAIAFAPSDPNIVYAGTGESTFSGASYGGLGMLKSVDGGASWFFVDQKSFSGRGISEIRIHPGDPETLLVASVSAVSPVPEFAPVGIYKSQDGGGTFTLKKEGQANDLEVHPNDFDLQYASLSTIFGGGEEEGLYRSWNQGETWEPVPGPWLEFEGETGRMELAIAPSTPSVMVVSVQDAISGDDRDGRLQGLWLTKNAWEASPAWEALAAPPTGNTLWYNQQISFHPDNPDVIFFGEISLWIFNEGSWSRITPPHVDQHAFAWSLGRLIVGNDGGVYSSPDLGDSWFEHNQDLTITQFYQGSLHPSNLELAIGGSQDNGTELWSGPAPWRLLIGGDGGPNLISPAQPDRNWLVSFQRLSLFRTTNGGQSFSRADQGIDRSDAPFIAPLKGCPFNEDVLIAGTKKVWKTETLFSSNSPAWHENGLQLDSEVSALAFSPEAVGCTTYAAGSLSGELYLTTDGGESWINLDPAGILGPVPITDLAFDDAQPSILTVALGGFHRSTDGSFHHLYQIDIEETPLSWKNVSPPLDIPVQAVALPGAEPGVIYAGTDLGLWKSGDGGDTWNLISPVAGVPLVTVYDLDVSPLGQIVAFTHGRGAWLRASSDSADLAVRMDPVAATTFLGETVEVTVRVVNNGPADGQDIELAVETDPPLQVRHLPPDCVALEARINCHRERLTARDNWSLNFPLAASQAQQVVISASVDTMRPEPVLNNNQASQTTTIVPPALDLIVPHFDLRSNANGLALLNPSTSSAWVQVTAFPDHPASLRLNPRSYHLGPRRQLAQLPDEIFDQRGEQGETWLRILSDRKPIGALFQFFGPGALDGGSAQPARAQKLTFTRVFQGTTPYRQQEASTQVTIVNPNAETVRVHLTHFSDPAISPLTASSTDLDIPPLEFMSQNCRELFGLEEMVGGAIVAEAAEGEGLAGFETIVVAGGQTLVGLPPIIENSGTVLYSAQVAWGADLSTNLKLYHSGQDPRHLRLDLFAEDGALAGTTSFSMQPGDFLEQDMSALFPGVSIGTQGGEGGFVTVSLVLTTDGPGIVGDVLFGDRKGRFAAALPLQRQLSTRAVFTQMANSASLFTGLAFHNPHPTSNELTLVVSTPSGTTRGIARLTLPPHGRLSKTVPELVTGATGQVDGYVTLESDLPVAVQQFFGDADLHFLSAVPPLILQ